MPHALLAAAQAIAPDLVADRRTIHQHPELAFQEVRTAAFVAERLRQLGLDVRTGVGETGVVGLLRGGLPGKTVLLRADMDALPIQEPDGLPFASQTPGVMHACGHDAHTAVLLGAARLLAERRHQLRGAVKFMFQPAEELNTAQSGAARMLQDGLLADPPVDAAFGLHVLPRHDVGTVAVCGGPAQASSDVLNIIVRGPGGHGARPEATVDVITVAAHILIALQTMVSREVSARESTVVTIGKIEAGDAPNVIPAAATMQGTVRTYSHEVRAFLRRRIPEVINGIAATFRATVAVEYAEGYPAVINDHALAALVAGAARDMLGAEAVEVHEPIMGSEDFSLILQRVPGAFFYLGINDPAWRAPRPNHSPSFALHEDALPVGAAVMAAVALRYLALGGGGTE